MTMRAPVFSADMARTARLYDLENDQDYIVVVVGVDKAGNEGPANANSWATNNTIKFAITQGVVRAKAAIQREIPSGGETELEDKFSDGQKHGAALYWLAAGMKENPTNHVMQGRVTKEYDLIYRDAPSFREDGTEQWTAEGTTKTNWNYQAGDFGALGRGNLRFYRASYKGRWNPSGGGRPLASEDVYAMNRVRLVEGRNLVALHGVPYTNTFAGVFGTDTNVLPAGTSLANATRVEFFTDANGGQSDAALSAKQTYYFLQGENGGYWYGDSLVKNPSGSPKGQGWYEYELSESKLVPSEDTEVVSSKTYYRTEQDVSHDEQPDGFFSRGFEIVIPDLTGFAGFTNHYNGNFVTNRGTNAVFKVTADGPYWNWEWGFDWYPILKVPSTNDTIRGYTKVTTTGGENPQARGWFERSGDNVWNYQYMVSSDTTVDTKKTYFVEEAKFSVVVQGGVSNAPRTTLVSLNMPVAAHPRDMRLVECGFHAGDGMTCGDVMFIWDNETGDPRDRSIVFYDGTNWMRWVGGSQTTVPEGFFKPNDVIVIQSRGTNDWVWTYSPADFYTMPTRWMGR